MNAAKAYSVYRHEAISLAEADGASLPEIVADLDAKLSHAAPEEILDAALQTAGADRFAIVSSFGTESAVLLAAAANVSRDIPILFIDTGYLFAETLAYRDILQTRLGLTDIRTLKTDASQLAAADPEGDLFQRDPDACCDLRKVQPLGSALEGFAAWANGRKRYQAASRAAIPAVERDAMRLKFNPLAHLSRAEVVTRFRNSGLPYHPLEKFGFASIGCMPCTSRVAPGEDPRAGRWRGRGKVECGIHVQSQGNASTG